ncbi:alpha-ketoacid dehydrogenase subunit beta [Emcibacter sp.]|uniref:alpha-ketoacid dehydrogenase subunit beta n=1 Tax=Emcibacter sp. TaxID=1979954 RepID=UPI003A902B07
MTEVKEQIRKIPVNRAIREALEHELTHDESTFLMGEDLALFGGVYQTATGFLEKFGPNRIMDTPISEAGFMAAATGAAMSGMKPIVELMFVDFVGVCLDPIYNAAAKGAYHSDGRQPVPMTIMTGIGGGYSDASQHSQTLYATFAHLPGIKVVVPSNAYDAKGLLTAAIRDPNPVVYMLHKRLTGMGWFEPVKEAAVHVPKNDFEVPIGKAKVVREGTDITLVGWGETLWMALFAARELEKEGCSAEVIDLRTIVPLDRETILESVKKTGRLVAVDEDYRMCGLAGEVIASVVEEDASVLKASPKRVTFPDIPIPFSRSLEAHVRPSTEKVVDVVKSIL